MNMLHVAGEPGKGFKFLCGTVVERMYVGLAVPIKGDFSGPALTLCYSPKCMSLVEAVTGEMAQRNIPPQVHIIYEGRSYEVLVLFLMKELPNVDFLASALSPADMASVRRMVGSELATVLMVGEAEFDQSERLLGMRDFLRRFKQAGKFLLVVGSTQAPASPGWSVEITTIARGYPNPALLV